MLRSVSASCTSPSWIHTQTPLLTRAGRTFISFSAALRSDNSRAGSRAQGDSNNDSEVYTGVEKDVGGQQFLTSSNGTNADTYTSKETSRSIHHSTLTDLEAARRNRKSEWKRRQGGQTFLDHSIITVRGGNGGNGCVAFHREKFKPIGPPSGGNGGRGSDVYILPTPALTTLSSVPRRIHGLPGGAGQGTWQHGKNAEPTVIRVPVGTVVKELAYDDPRRAPDEWEAEDEALREFGAGDERRAAWRDRRWVHYPRWQEDNVGRDTFQQAEKLAWMEERERRRAKRRRYLNPLHVDLSEVENEAEVSEADVNAPLGLGKREYLGRLIARGGSGGMGNPNFVAQMCRSPKFATKGQEGERVTLSLELKILADVGLVGMPNAGKSTLLRALTGGRAKTEVASYAFTTLNPVVGVIRVADDGTFEGELRGVGVFDETVIEERRELEKQLSEDAEPALEPAPPFVIDPDAPSLPHSDVTQQPGFPFDILESFRFTIADNPGLIAGASSNIGLGHSFLRSLERSHALVYVVDLAGEAPWEELRALRDELEVYMPGMSNKARMVIANKADLLVPGDEGSKEGEEAVENAKKKLHRLEEFVKTEMMVLEKEQATGMRFRAMDVVPISAKFGQNLKKVVMLMRGYVEDARKV